MRIDLNNAVTWHIHVTRKTFNRTESPAAVRLFLWDRCSPKHYLWLEKMEASKMSKDRED